MLSYLIPKKTENIEKNLRDLEEKNGPNDRFTQTIITGFLKGCISSNKSGLSKQSGCYKTAEQKVSALEVEVEKAEFYDKLAEIYYYISQRYLSINYAPLASDIFNRDYMPLLKSWF